MSEPFLGQIIMFGGNFAPRGWALCDGQLLAISSNSALFSILGTTYGGDGRTTFGLPDLRGRVPIHAGTGPGLSPRSLGSRAGAQTVQLSVADLPPHSHQVRPETDTHTLGADADLRATSSPADTSDPLGNSLAMAPIYKSEPPTASLSDASNEVNQHYTDATGSGAAHSTMQPYQAVNFIIALQGTFPSRN